MAASNRRHWHLPAKRPVMDEERRLAAPAGTGWKLWGPYVSERQWGTVREDYSPGGTAWDSFSHDAARSRACRWGEDGIGNGVDRSKRTTRATSSFSSACSTS